MNMKMSGDFEPEADALGVIAERLADASIDLLSAAIRDGDSKLPGDVEHLEREIQKARRCVVKAEGILRGINARRDD
jgi:hypothetical protein